MDKYIVSIGVDISNNDVNTNSEINKKIENELKKLSYPSVISNITGDDITITSLISEDRIEQHNKKIIEILKKHAESFDDLNGISANEYGASEGISYAISKNCSKYGDALIISFDTYGGEDFVNSAALFVEDIGKKYGYDSNSSVFEGKSKYIPGVGYVGSETDDPVVVISCNGLDEIHKLSCLIFGGLLSFDRVYFVKRGSGIDIVPPGVIYTMSAFLGGNVIDLYNGIKRKYNLL